MTSLSTLKKNSKTAFDKIASSTAKLNQKNNNTDERYWYPDVDKAGNGYSIIRLLPAPGLVDDDMGDPYVRYYSHSFKASNGQWYIENCRTSLGPNNPDPVCEYNNKLWNSTSDGESPTRKQASAQRRNQVFVSNIFVVKDSLHPENDQKWKLYRYGKKIFDKINFAMNPEFEDQTPFDPFNMWEGANLVIRIRNVEKRRNYDASTFEDIGSPLFKDDKKIEEVWKQCINLDQFIQDKNFKTYDQLNARLNVVLGLNGGSPPPKPQSVQNPWQVNPEEAVRIINNQGETKAPKGRTRPVKDAPAPVDEDVEADPTSDDNQDVAFFQKLAQQ